MSRGTTGTATPFGWREFEGGLVETGHDGQGFAFDNEGPRHRSWLDAFAIALIPHTLAVTTLGVRPVGARVNLEVDLVAKYVEALVARRVTGSTREHTA